MAPASRKGHSDVIRSRRVTLALLALHRYAEAPALAGHDCQRHSQHIRLNSRPSQPPPNHSTPPHARMPSSQGTRSWCAPRASAAARAADFPAGWGGGGAWSGGIRYSQVVLCFEFAFGDMWPPARRSSRGRIRVIIRHPGGGGCWRTCGDLEAGCCCFAAFWKGDHSGYGW